jgi:hypothetical protein
MNLKNITSIQWMGIIILFNTTLLGGSSQLGDLLLSPVVVKAILAAATLGNGFLGGLVTMFGGISSQAVNVAGENDVRVVVGRNASTTMAALAVDHNQPKIGAADPQTQAALAAKVG